MGEHARVVDVILRQPRVTVTLEVLLALALQRARAAPRPRGRAAPVTHVLVRPTHPPPPTRLVRVSAPCKIGATSSEKAQGREVRCSNPDQTVFSSENTF